MHLSWTANRRRHDKLTRRGNWSRTSFTNPTFSLSTTLPRAPTSACARCKGSSASMLASVRSGLSGATVYTNCLSRCTLANPSTGRSLPSPWDISTRRTSSTISNPSLATLHRISRARSSPVNKTCSDEYSFWKIALLLRGVPGLKLRYLLPLIAIFLLAAAAPSPRLVRRRGYATRR